MVVVSVVTGTYNRLKHLQTMVDSVRTSVGSGTFPLEIVVVDGGSDDGTIEWCEKQRDIVLIEQGELLGAVKAFNAGFQVAVGKYVIISNDDVEFIHESIPRAVVFMEENPDVGIGCFFQNRGNMPWHVEYMPALRPNGKQVSMPYGQVCIVPRWIGDKVGWWGDYLHTYGGDNELSCNVLEAGYKVVPIQCACINDLRVDDELRKINLGGNLRGGVHPDTVKWTEKWTRGGKVGPIVRPQPAFSHEHEKEFRVLYIPIYEQGYKVQKEQKRGLRDALSETALVMEYDYLEVAQRSRRESVDYLYDLAESWEPHLFLFQLHDHDTFTWQDISELKVNHPAAKFANWNGDFHPDQLYDPQYIRMMQQFDAVGLVTTLPKSTYTQEGIRWFYWQISYEGKDVKPTKNTPKHDLVFLANGYSAERVQLAKFLRGLDIDVGLYGSWPQELKANGSNLYDFHSGHRIYRNARLALSDSQWPSATGFVSNRLFQAMYSGVHLLQQHFDGMEELLGLQDGVHLSVWEDEEELQSMIEYFMTNRTESEKIGQRGKEFIMREHSFEVRVRELYEFLGYA